MLIQPKQKANLIQPYSLSENKETIDQWCWHLTRPAFAQQFNLNNIHNEHKITHLDRSVSNILVMQMFPWYSLMNVNIAEYISVFWRINELNIQNSSPRIEMLFYLQVKSFF